MLQEGDAPKRELLGRRKAKGAKEGGKKREKAGRGRGRTQERGSPRLSLAPTHTNTHPRARRPVWRCKQRAPQLCETIYKYVRIMHIYICLLKVCCRIVTTLLADHNTILSLQVEGNTSPHVQPNVFSTPYDTYRKPSGSFALA